MALDIIAALIFGAIVFISFMVHIAGRWKQVDHADTGTALVEFGMSFPGEAIREIVVTEDDKTRFFRLASGKTGFQHVAGTRSISRLIEPGQTQVELVEAETGDMAAGLRIEFSDSSFPPRTFRFASPEDAAEVSLWLMGAMIPAAEPLPDPS